MKRSYVNPAADRYYEDLREHLCDFPFSFVYGGVKYKGFSSDNFKLKNEECDTAQDKETRIYTFGFCDELDIRLILTHYFSHGVTEWTVWFDNNSQSNSEVIERPEVALTFEGRYPILKGILGDHVNQYSPYSIDMQNNMVEFSSDSGRATHINFPYFNLECGDGGVMLAIGWAGTWCARFESDGEKTQYTASSVNGIRTYLKPGESIRTALFVRAPYTVRGEHYATNFWRSWFVRHNLPPADGDNNALEPFSTCCLFADTGRPNSDGSISECHTTWRPTLEKMIAENAKVDYRWFDAGWYIAPDGTSAEPFVKGHDWWDTVGTWELDPIKWPGKTFRESTDFARDNGMKTLVWFEPERVTDPDNLVKNYGYKREWAIQIGEDKTISNNIGDPECLAWTTERICKMLRENRVEMYREDNNCNAARLWKHLDGIEGENRCGITESKFIIGHYKMWDDIIACTLSYGGCGFVDSCASGGGRNDLESMRRGVPILRSDSDRKATALRLSMTTAFNKWIPFCGANTREKQAEMAKTGVSDKYVWRSSYLAILNVDSQFVYAEDQNFDILRFGLGEWKSIKPYLLKEFYTLTPWHKENDNTDFTAFAYFDPEEESGIILAFRQERCERKEITLALPFVANGEKYEAVDEDTGDRVITDGRITVGFASPREAKLIRINKKRS